jgi:hypothetical protein
MRLRSHLELKRLNIEIKSQMYVTKNGLTRMSKNTLCQKTSKPKIQRPGLEL